MIRPELREALLRWREVAGALALSAGGLWVFTFGGWFYQGLGVAIVVAGFAGVVVALRRMRFRRAVDQPGIVEVDEGQLRYFGPYGGGFAALPEVVALDLVPDRDGGRWWRLSERGGNVLSIPVAAEGADLLFDAFATLPGLSGTDLLSALDAPGDRAVTVWRRTPLRALP